MSMYHGKKHRRWVVTVTVITLALQLSLVSLILVCGLSRHRAIPDYTSGFPLQPNIRRIQKTRPYMQCSVAALGQRKESRYITRGCEEPDWKADGIGEYIGVPLLQQIVWTCAGNNVILRNICEFVLWDRHKWSDHDGVQQRLKTLTMEDILDGNPSRCVCSGTSMKTFGGKRWVTPGWEEEGMWDIGI